MSDIKLDLSTHDIAIENGNLVLVEDDEAVAQNLKIRLQFFWQEWFYDLRLGIPYFRDIFVKNPDRDLINSLYRKTIKTTTGVDAVTSLSTTIDKSTRRFTLNFRALLDSGAELIYEPFVLDI